MKKCKKTKLPEYKGGCKSDNYYINKTHEWWNDLYTDANGQCYSDADPGL
jgi:hypothetical protein